VTYRVCGLDPEEFSFLENLDRAQLAAHRAQRVIADADRGFPCRISLEDARKGESLLLVHHVHHNVDGPYRSAFAIFVRENAQMSAEYIDSCPPVFEGRPISLRGFDQSGALVDARLVADGKADTTIRVMLADPVIAHINAHNAAHGCFAARIERYGDAA